jgi:hypothetical protein
LCVSFISSHIVLPFLCTSHEKGAIPYAKNSVISDGIVHHNMLMVKSVQVQE